MPVWLCSSKPTAWVHQVADLQDMPSKCPHDKRTWFNDSNGSAVSAKHRPTTGKTTYSLVQSTPTRMATCGRTCNWWLEECYRIPQPPRMFG